MNSSFGVYLELLKVLRNEIFICFFEKSVDISEVIIKCLEARSFLRIKCCKSFYQTSDYSQWNITLRPFADDTVCIEISQMNIIAKQKLKALLEFGPLEGFSQQTNGGDYGFFEEFKYDLDITHIIKEGFLLLLFVDHMESLKSKLIDEMIVNSSAIKEFIPIPYKSGYARKKLLSYE